jgi:hypothetical protein
MNPRLVFLFCAIFVAWVSEQSLYAQSPEPEAAFKQELGEFDKALQQMELGAAVEKCVLRFVSLNEEEKKECEELRNTLTRILQEPTFCHGNTITEPKNCTGLGEDCLTCCTAFENEETCKKLVCGPLSSWSK